MFFDRFLFRVWSIQLETKKFQSNCFCFCFVEKKFICDQKYYFSLKLCQNSAFSIAFSKKYNIEFWLSSKGKQLFRFKNVWKKVIAVICSFNGERNLKKYLHFPCKFYRKHPEFKCDCVDCELLDSCECSVAEKGIQVGRSYIDEDNQSFVTCVSLQTNWLSIVWNFFFGFFEPSRRRIINNVRREANAITNNDRTFLNIYHDVKYYMIKRFIRTS